MRTHATAAFGVATAALTACTSVNCGDPRTDGLGAALACTTGGGYQAQTDALNRRASERQTIAEQLAAENTALQAQQSDLDVQERALTGQLINLNSRIAALESDLKQRLNRQEITQVEYDLAVNELDALNQRRVGIGPGDADALARIQQLEDEIGVLQNLFE